MRLLIFILLTLSSISNAQTDSLAILQGTVKDEKGEPLIGATLKVSQNGNFMKGTITDFEGKYQISLAPGKYDLEVRYTGFYTLRLANISLIAGQEELRDIELTSTPLICEYIPMWIVPLIDMTPGNTGAIFTASQIRNRY